MITFLTLGSTYSTRDRGSRHFPRRQEHCKRVGEPLTKLEVVAAVVSDVLFVVVGSVRLTETKTALGCIEIVARARRNRAIITCIRRPTATAAVTETYRVKTRAIITMIALHEQVALSSPLHHDNNNNNNNDNASNRSTTVVPKSLPDLDDVSMTQVTSYIEHSQQDVYWSFLSDSFFVSGGICYVVLSIPSLKANPPSTVLAVLEFVAPVVYLLNSLIDVKWAQSGQQRSRVKNEMTETWNYWRIVQQQQPQQHGDETTATTIDNSHQQGETSSRNDRRNQPWYIRLRKHAAHRRTLMAAWTFGIAAYFSVLSVVVPHVKVLPLADFVPVLDGVSVIFYILSALISVSGKRTRPWLSISQDESGLLWMDSPETLEDLGDILFLIGSIVDAVLCFATFDDDRPGWAMTSSILWLIDACLYLKADFVVAHKMNNHHDDGGNVDGKCPLQRSDGTFV